MKRTSTKVIAAFLLGASVAGGIATAATSEPLGVKVCVDKRTQAIYLAGSNGCSTTRTAITLGAPTIDVKSIAGYKELSNLADRVEIYSEEDFSMFKNFN